MTVIPTETACIRCVFETVPDENEIRVAARAGIVGPVAGAMARCRRARRCAPCARKKPLPLRKKFSLMTRPGRSRVRITGVSPRPGCGAVLPSWSITSRIRRAK